MATQISKTGAQASIATMPSSAQAVYALCPSISVLIPSTPLKHAATTLKPNAESVRISNATLHWNTLASTTVSPETTDCHFSAVSANARGIPLVWTSVRESTARITQNATVESATTITARIKLIARLHAPLRPSCNVEGVEASHAQIMTETITTNASTFLVWSHWGRSAVIVNATVTLQRPISVTESFAMETMNARVTGVILGSVLKTPTRQRHALRMRTPVAANATECHASQIGNAKTIHATALNATTRDIGSSFLLALWFQY